MVRRWKHALSYRSGKKKKKRIIAAENGVVRKICMLSFFIIDRYCICEWGYAEDAFSFSFVIFWKNFLQRNALRATVRCFFFAREERDSNREQQRFIISINSHKNYGVITNLLIHPQSDVFYTADIHCNSVDSVPGAEIDRWRKAVRKEGGPGEGINKGVLDKRRWGVERWNWRRVC